MPDRSPDISALRRLLHPHDDHDLQQQSRELLLALSGHLDRPPLRDVRIINMSLHAIDLRGVILARAHLTSVDFTDADLRGADLRGATLHNVTLTRTHAPRCAPEGHPAPQHLPL